MKFYVGVTDNDWFRFLRRLRPEDINFWQPGRSVKFKAIEYGAPFLFKLKSPNKKIAGVGFFANHSFLPVSVAWDTFGFGNGCETLEELQRKIYSYRKDNHPNLQIGCITLSSSIFFDDADWIDAPENWANSIVQGKTYDTSSEIGEKIWNKVESLLLRYETNYQNVNKIIAPSEVNEQQPRYGQALLSRIRLGQGAFRVLVTEAYERKCAISGEKTLPVLEAAHIKPYKDEGPHKVSNGVLLRADFHKLFDNGYLTITKDYKIEVSGRIKEEFENGKEYYQYHGKSLIYLPIEEKNRPNIEYIDWHNLNIYKG